MERLLGTRTRAARDRVGSGYTFGIVTFFVGLAIGITFMTVAQGQPTWVWISRFIQNTAAAIAGALLTLVLIERVLLRRVVSGSEMVLSELIDALREDDEAAVEAADLLAVAGHFRSGDLCRENLTGAQLAGRNLSRSSLSGTKLRAANLRDTDLRKANLQAADLSLADLRRADLSGANLIRAKLWMAYLHGADLRRAQISEKALQEAFSLRGALMPDGTRYDGRFGLSGDLEAAAEAGINGDDALAHWYTTCAVEDTRIEIL
jgi:uncharacterized protein YjbI with pentapeptide repeats